MKDVFHKHLIQGKEHAVSPLPMDTKATPQEAIGKKQAPRSSATSVTPR